MTFPGHWLALVLRRDSQQRLSFSLPRVAMRELRREASGEGVAWVALSVRWNGVAISCAPCMYLPCAAGSPPAWTQSNQGLFHDATTDSCDIAMLDPHTRERQRSCLRVRHTLRGCSSEDAFFPFTGIQWCPDESELLQFIVQIASAEA